MYVYTCMLPMYSVIMCATICTYIHVCCILLLYLRVAVCLYHDLSPRYWHCSSHKDSHRPILLFCTRQLYGVGHDCIWPRHPGPTASQRRRYCHGCVHQILQLFWSCLLPKCHIGSNVYLSPKHGGPPMLGAACRSSVICWQFRQHVLWSQLREKYCGFF